MASLSLLALALLAVYALLHLARPFFALYRNLSRARAIGLPIKLIPLPQGLIAFFANQLVLRLHLAKPGSPLHKLLNVGRPEGYDMHKELGDLFLTVSPYGIGLIVADPDVISYVTGKRVEFPKPPNTGAIINIYGRNVINADGDVWRLHRRVTGPVFSERIHGVVWREGQRQTDLMMRSWDPSLSSSRVTVPTLHADTLRLGLHVITGSAYGTPLGWRSNPPTTSTNPLCYFRSLEELNANLMTLFLTPRWLLKLAPENSTWGRAWGAYEAFGGYLKGMLQEQRRRMQFSRDEADENLLSVLIDSEDGVGEKEGMRMSKEEVLGNCFIFLFAGHETTANTTHYALLLLALHQDVQKQLHDEIDEMHAFAATEGRTELEYERDFPRAVWAVAVMYETLRLFSPTAVVNKYTTTDQPISFAGKPYIIPADTRISINITGVHSSPQVWGGDASVWRPARWVGPAPTSDSPSPRPSTPQTRPGTPSSIPAPAFHPPASASAHDAQTILRPPKGTFLPFSEGVRQCSGKKFATVEFVAVVCSLLREYRVEILGEEDGWGEERVRTVVRGRKARALTLQPPEAVPVRFVRRR